MRYTRANGYALLAIAVACFILDAPVWIFALTGLAAIVFGFIGLRQNRAEATEDTEI